MISLRRVRAIAVKEGRQLRRDRLTIGMVVVGLALMVLSYFGLAAPWGRRASTTRTLVWISPASSSLSVCFWPSRQPWFMSCSRTAIGRTGVATADDRTG